MVSRQTDKETMETRVYKYGLIPLGYPPEEAISELWRANKLWNKLVELHRKSRDDYEEARCKAHRLYGEVAERLAAINEEIDQAYADKRTAQMQARTRDASKSPLIKEAIAAIDKLREKRKAIYAEMKPIRKEADTHIDKKALTDAFRKTVNEAVKVKNTGGLYSVTADEVKRYFTTARERSFKPDGGELRFHSFDRTGFYAFRFRRKDARVDGVSFEELFQCNKQTDRRFAFTDRDDSHKIPRIILQATLAGGAKKDSKIKQEFDLIYHRPIPEDGQIQDGKIIRTRIGDRFKYHVVLTVKRPKRTPQTIPKNAAIGIDLGFKSEKNDIPKDHIRVATIASSDFLEPARHIDVPFSPKDKKPNKSKKRDKLAKMNHSSELQSLLAEAAAELGKATKPILKDDPTKPPILKDDSLPEDKKRFYLWKDMTKYPSNVTLSFEKAYKVAIAIRQQKKQEKPNLFPPQVEKLVQGWWATYGRKYRELHNLRAKLILDRKHFYRQVAFDLVTKKQLIALEDMNLTGAFNIPKDKDDVYNNKARAQRFLAAASEFRNAIINAANREGIPVIGVPPQYTSKMCSACQEVNKDLKSETTWKCPSCGITHDRDENAARNIAILGLKKHFEEGKNKKK
jgi:transposase